jgi:hypothetical protein
MYPPAEVMVELLQPGRIESELARKSERCEKVERDTHWGATFGTEQARLLLTRT